MKKDNRPTTTIIVKYELASCRDCPMVESKPTPRAGYGAYDYFCTANDNVKVMGYVEWQKDEKPVPEWCPYRLEKIYGL